MPGLRSTRSQKRLVVTLTSLAIAVPGAYLLLRPAVEREPETVSQPAKTGSAQRPVDGAADAVREGNNGAGVASAAIAAGAANPCDFDDIQRSLDLLAQRRTDEETGLADSRDRLRIAAVATLAASTDAEHLHAAAWLTDDESERLSLLTRATEINADDSFLLFSAVQSCRKAGIASGCPLETWQARLLELDRDNSIAWGEVAVNRYLAGDLDGARDALRQGAAAARTRQYWTDMILLIERGLAASTELGFSERALIAFGHGASRGGPSYNAINAMCQTDGAERMAWAYPCMAFAETVEAGSETYLGRIIMLHIQANALEVIGGPDARAAVDRRRVDLEAAFRSSIDAADPLAQRLLFAEPGFFARFLATMRASGEIDAMAYADEEARRWRTERTLAACDN